MYFSSFSQKPQQSPLLQSHPLNGHPLKPQPSVIQAIALNTLKTRLALGALLLAGVVMIMATQAVSADEANYGVGTKAADQWLMAKYDSNGDSAITAEEISQKRERMFSAMDDDGDGIVSLDEYELLDVKKRALIVKSRFAKLDKNGDGQLTDDEYVGYYGSFGAFDLDGDGNITSAEMKLDPKYTKAKLQTADGSKCLLWLCVRASIH
ncbi:MAG: hypothetical protein U5M23_04885 [Marinagarivorans sp.]|nr:hypothetical protein [Marinagarivorans sp.]